MKIKKIFGIALVLVVIAFLAIPKSTYQKWFNNHQEEAFDDYHYVYVADESNKLVGVKVKFNKEKEFADCDDVIKQKWQILTNKMNLIPKGFSSTIAPTTLLNDYKIENNCLVLNVSIDIDHSASKLATDAIAWTFCTDEIKTVNLVVDDKVINKINDYSFNVISKDNGVNIICETSFLLEAKASTIIFYDNDLIRPVTFIYDENVEQCDFVLNKIFKNYNCNLVNYQYELKEQQLVIDIDDLVSVKDEMARSLEASFIYNLNVDSIIVNSDNTVLYEKK